MTAINIFIFISALWRLVSLFANEDGPFYVFQRLREIVKQIDTSIAFFHSFRLYEGYTCEWCLSIWIAAPLSLFWYWQGDIIIYILFPLACSTWVIFLKYAIQNMEIIQDKLSKEQS